MTVQPQRHTLAYDPVALWQFNETLADTSGNGLTLVVEVGTERYSDLYPGVRGIQLLGNRLAYTTLAAGLAITGDITIECLLYLVNYPSSQEVAIACYANAGETSSDNVLYAFQLNGTDGTFGWLSESGSGTNATYNVNFGPGLGLSHLAVTRTSNVIQYYLNGRAIGAASSALTAPTGGSSARFRIGYPDVGYLGPECVMSSLKVCNIALSAAQIAAEYNLTLGPLAGFV